MNGLWGIRRRHGQGLAWLALGKVVEVSHMWSFVHLPWGLKPAGHIRGDQVETICICFIYIQCFINSLAELPGYNTERSACSHLSNREAGMEEQGDPRAKRKARGS